MLASIHPLGERARGRRWGITVSAFIAGAGAAGASAGGLLGLAVLAVSAWAGLAIAAAFGLVRGAIPLLAAGVQTPQQLSALHQRLQRWAPLSRRVTLATQLAVAAVALTAVARA